MRFVLLLCPTPLLPSLHLLFPLLLFFFTFSSPPLLLLLLIFCFSFVRFLMFCTIPTLNCITSGKERERYKKFLASVCIPTVVATPSVKAGGGSRVSVAHFSLSCPATNLIKKFLHPFFSHFSIVVVLIALLNFLMRESAKIAKRQKQKENE